MRYLTGFIGYCVFFAIPYIIVPPILINVLIMIPFSVELPQAFWNVYLLGSMVLISLRIKIALPLYATGKVEFSDAIKVSYSTFRGYVKMLFTFVKSK